MVRQHRTEPSRSTSRRPQDPRRLNSPVATTMAPIAIGGCSVAAGLGAGLGPQPALWASGIWVAVTFGLSLTVELHASFASFRLKRLQLELNDQSDRRRAELVAAALSLAAERLRTQEVIAMSGLRRPTCDGADVDLPDLIRALGDR